VNGSGMERKPDMPDLEVTGRWMYARFQPAGAMSAGAAGGSV